MSERQYSEEEVAAILRRTAEIEGANLNATRERGLSLSDLESIAEESGLDPASVREAARELSRAATASPALAPAQLPSGRHLRHERSFDGEIDDADLERLVQLAGTHLNVPGTATREGEGWSWSGRWGHRQLSVRARSAHGRTTLELEESLGKLARSLHGGLMGGLGSFGLAFGFVFGGEVERSWGGALIFAAIGAVLAVGAGALLSHVLFRQKRLARDLQLQRVVTELDREGRRLAREPGDSAAAPDEQESAREPGPVHSQDEDPSESGRRPVRDRDQRG